MLYSPSLRNSTLASELDFESQDLNKEDPRGIRFHAEPQNTSRILPNGTEVNIYYGDSDPGERVHWDNLNALVPEGLRDVLSIDTKDEARLCVGDRGRCQESYKVDVVAMATKLPAWFFTAY